MLVDPSILTVVPLGTELGGEKVELPAEGVLTGGVTLPGLTTKNQ
ncbi:hypothetical protein COO91_07315 [Nostoc flagelliforme CCNUN1]|uniref:Uncharacterized protein n=1 Tax=Nostoc flagelliforme CCNUN1 TaxID=2038116 RepID=A0A2K8T0P4_9NOSO|nr:hypothetical protein COO91_07315 [Nostoc flagelliforme CCNUN1]